MAQTKRHLLRKPFMLFAVPAMILFGVEVNAQDANSACPCFNYEEVESIFQRGAQQTAEGGMTYCSAEDYSVENKAEVSVWDQNNEMVAQAVEEWFNYDPGGCNYVDKAGNPGVERNVKWPNPTPEAVAKACFEIISSVIAKSDVSGKCTTYP